MQAAKYISTKQKKLFRGTNTRKMRNDKIYKSSMSTYSSQETFGLTS